MTKKSDEQDTAALEAGHPDNVAGAALHTDAVVGLGLARGEMTEVIPPEGKQAEVAKALNDAAQDLGLLSQVQWVGDRFSVPPEVADKAKFGKGVTEVDVPEQPATIAQPTVVHQLGDPADQVSEVPDSAAAGHEGPDGTGAPKVSDTAVNHESPTATKPTTARSRSTK